MPAIRATAATPSNPAPAIGSAEPSPAPNVTLTPAKAELASNEAEAPAAIKTIFMFILLVHPDDGLNFCVELGPRGKPQFPCHSVQTVIFKLDFHRRIREDGGALKEKALDIL
jgi:hypothetical protein